MSDFEKVVWPIPDPDYYGTQPHPEPYCGVYWIITTCLTAIALGAALGVLLWLAIGDRIWVGVPS